MVSPFSSRFGLRILFFSGGGGGGGGTSEGTPMDRCEDLVVVTTLNSPVPAILVNLHPGDELSLAINEQGGRRILTAITAGAEIAGSVTSAALFRLMDCIDKKHTYGARVELIDGGRCIVKISWRGHHP